MRVRWGWVLLVVAMLLVAWSGWALWTAYRVDRDLSAAVTAADQLRASVRAGDQRGTDQALADLQRSSRSAADRTDSVTWWVAGHAPVIGDDLRGVATVSDVVADLSETGVAQLVQVSGELDTLLPENGRVPLDGLTQIQEPVASGSQAFGTAADRLSEVDSSSFVGPLATRYRDLADQVDAAATALHGADIAVQVMPAMLGQDGPRSYLLVSQNNAEVRATGGLPGAVSLVRADQGKVRLTDQVAANSFGERATPVLPLTPAELQIYGEQLGTYFLDANFTGDYPRASQLWAARWQEVYGGRLDGVVSVDPVALSYLLQATGPLQVGDVRLTAANAVDVLLHQTYIDHPVPADQDAFFKQVARGVFDKITAGAGDPIAIARALGRAAAEHRILIHSFDGATQSALSYTAVSGEMTDPDADGPQVGVYLNDGTGSKMSYFLRHAAYVDATGCTDGQQSLSGTLQLASQAPKNAADLPRYITGGGAYGTQPGHQLVFVRLVAPIDGGVSDVRLAGRPVPDVTAVPQGRRLVATIPVDLAPGEDSTLTWQMTSGPGQAGDTAVSVTPSVDPGQASSTTPSACTG